MVLCLGRKAVRLDKSEKLGRSLVKQRLKDALNVKPEQTDCLILRHQRLPSL